MIYWILVVETLFILIFFLSFRRWLLCQLVRKMVILILNLIPAKIKPEFISQTRPCCSYCTPNFTVLFLRYIWTENILCFLWTALIVMMVRHKTLRDTFPNPVCDVTCWIISAVWDAFSSSRSQLNRQWFTRTCLSTASVQWMPSTWWVTLVDWLFSPKLVA